MRTRALITSVVSFTEATVPLIQGQVVLQKTRKPWKDSGNS